MSPPKHQKPGTGVAALPSIQAFKDCRPTRAQSLRGLGLVEPAVGKNIFNKKVFPRLLNDLRKIYYIAFDDFKASRIRDRLVIANNFLQFVSKLIRNHGAVFAIK
jgi:hypothetical protein